MHVEIREYVRARGRCETTSSHENISRAAFDELQMFYGIGENELQLATDIDVILVDGRENVDVFIARDGGKAAILERLRTNV